MHIVCGLPESPTKIAMVGRLLANARLNLHLYNEDELTPVHIAISKDYHKQVVVIMEAILERQRQSATASKNVVDKFSDQFFRTMELILQSRPQQLNADTGNGFPPLLLAAFYGRRRCTESLIEVSLVGCLGYIRKVVGFSHDIRSIGNLVEVCNDDCLFFRHFISFYLL